MPLPLLPTVRVPVTTSSEFAPSMLASSFEPPLVPSVTVPKPGRQSLGVVAHLSTDAQNWRSRRGQCRAQIDEEQHVEDERGMSRRGNVDRTGMPNAMTSWSRSGIAKSLRRIFPLWRSTTIYSRLGYYVRTSIHSRGRNRRRSRSSSERLARPPDALVSFSSDQSDQVTRFFIVETTSERKSTPAWVSSTRRSFWSPSVGTFSNSWSPPLPAIPAPRTSLCLVSVG